MDRRGNLIWYDDFEAAAAPKWQYVMAAGGSVALSTDRAWMGNQSMKCVTDVDAGDYAYIAKKFCLPIERTIGAEVMFYLGGGKPIVILRIYANTGSIFAVVQVKYDHNTGKLYYSDSTGADVELPRTDNITLLGEYWLYIKLVADWDKLEYVRLMFGSTTYDLSGIAMQSAASAVEKNLFVYVRNNAATAEAATVYFDNFILTQNEP
jgi:hypothetical protein